MTQGISQETLDLLYAKKWSLLLDDEGRAIDQCFRHDCAYAFERDLLAKRIRSHRVEMEECPFAKPRELNEGEFILGFTQRGTPIKIPFSHMGAPSLIIGSTGSGKTTTARYWSLQAGLLCRGAFFIDSRKTEMRVLQPAYKQLGVSLAVVNAYDMKLNPLQVPDGVDPRSYAPNAVDALVSGLRLPPGGRKVFHQALHHLYQTRGIFDGNTTNYPTLFELRDFVWSAKMFHAQTRDSVVTTLDPVLMSLRSTLAYRRGWSTDDLAKRKTVFEFNTCSETSKDLLANTLIMPQFVSRVAKSYSNVQPNLFIYVDEGSSFIENDEGTISQWIGLIRGVGLSLLISNQSAVTISQRVLSNIPNRFIAQCSSFADLNVLATSVGLDADQKRYLSLNLKPGLLMGSLGQGDWRHPFLFTTPLLKQSHGTTQVDDVANRELDSLPVVPAPEFDDWQPEWARREVIRTKDGSPVLPSPIGLDSAPPADCLLKPDELWLLQGIVDNPCQPVSFYPGKVHMSKRTVHRLRKALVAKQLIQEQPMQISGRGRPSILLAPTPQALALLKESEK
jgi:hypothetical protein